jgi:hyaluronoglucosaminidase
MESFAHTVSISRQVGVDFSYAISPGGSIRYAASDDFECLLAKLGAFYDLGVRTFSLLLDDITPRLRDEADRARYGSYAEAQAYLCNRVFEHLKAQDPACSLSMCPTEYHGKPPFSDYLSELGERLHTEIDIFYTGPQVCSASIRLEDVQAFTRVVGRKPLIWDNYPVNDLSMQPELHIGPITGRESTLYQGVKGVVVNPMIQAEASKVSLLTFADYFSDPHGYDPQASWKNALRQVAGCEVYPALYYLAENSLYSCLSRDESTRLAELSRSALASLSIGVPPTVCMELQKLEAYLNELDDACYTLLNRMENLSLRSNLIPWIELLQYWVWMGQYSTVALKSTEAADLDQQAAQFMHEYKHAALKHPKRIAGSALLPLAEYVQNRAGSRQEAVGTDEPVS